MIILGIDPALTQTGWGIISSSNNNLSFIACGTIKTDAKQSLDVRLHHIHKSIKEVIDIHQPNEVAIEETFVNKNPVSSLKLGHARGVLMLSAAIAGLKISEYASTSIKKTVVGVGRADKNQVGVMIKYLLPKSTAKTEDESDALAVAICHNNFRLINKLSSNKNI
ncbi:MAG: crossover junction endodeoxyribonuclease RuvC [Rickettsiales bacterium]|jgi:crossover junction endodeoxyribonuclease RuvC